MSEFASMPQKRGLKSSLMLDYQVLNSIFDYNDLDSYKPRFILHKKR
jgi:hypothetical protein